MAGVVGALAGAAAGWIVLAGCHAGLALVSSIETALCGVTEARAQEAREKHLPNAQHLSFWLASSGKVLITLTVLRLSLILGGTLQALRLTAGLWPAWLVVAAQAALLLVVGRIIPSVIAKRFALEWSLATVRVIRLLTYLLTPLVWPLIMLMQAVGWVVGSPSDQSPRTAFWTPEELGRLAAEPEGVQGSSRDLLRSIIEFSDTVIREVMVPRTEMMTLPVTATVEEVRRALLEGGHSRIPVYETTLDHILGILYVKDVSTHLSSDAPAEIDLVRLVRPTFYVPEVMKISDVLREFQRRKTHLAIVVDEYGGTAGLVTLEDIIEEIVGEIHDEYDVEEKQFRVLPDNKIIADGRVSLWDLEEALGVEFPEDGAYETLAGFITARVGYLPEPGTVVSWNNLRFTVKEANERRVGTVEIERRKVEATARV